MIVRVIRVEDIAASADFRHLRSLRGVLHELRYASTNNFAGRNLYGRLDCAWLRSEAAAGLEAAGAWLERARPGWKLLVCTGLVLWGISILSGFNWRTLHMGRGEWETLGAAAAFTVQIILLERPRYRANRAMPVTLLMFLGFAAWSAPVAVLAAPQLTDLWRVIATPAAAAHLAVLAVVCTVFAYGIMNLWQPRVPATEAGLIYCIEPVCTAVYALFLPGLLSGWTGVPYPNETLTGILITGGLLITAANILLQVKFKTPAAEPVS